MNHRRFFALALPALLLAGCDGGSGEDDRTASGQVLEGSASDAMIPLERLTSQPPLARDRAVAEGDTEVGEAVVDEAPADEGPGDNPLYADDGTPL